MSRISRWCCAGHFECGPAPEPAGLVTFHLLERLDMRKRLVVLMTLSASALAGCARPSPAPMAPLAKAAPTKPNPIIVRIVSRRYMIVVSAGKLGPLYTVTNAAGQVVADGVTLAELRLVDNNLYQELVPAIAPSASADASSVNRGGVMIADK